MSVKIEDWDKAIDDLGLDDTSTYDKVEDCLDRILEKSRSADNRVWLVAYQPCRYIQHFGLDATVDGEEIPPSIRLKALKCIANFIAHDDDEDSDRRWTDHMYRGGLTSQGGARHRIMDYPGGLAMLASFIRFGTANNKEGDYERACVSLKVAYNLCIGYDVAQDFCIKYGKMDRAVLDHMQACLTTLKHDTLELAVDLLGLLSPRIDKQFEGPYESDKDVVNQVLRLPCIEDIDHELFVAMIEAISPYLSNANFQELMLPAEQLALGFALLERTAFMVSSQSSVESDHSSEQIMLRCLSDVSTLENFPKTYDSAHKLSRTLVDRCILSEAEIDRPSVAVAACILLGNYATDAQAAANILPRMKLTELYDSITLMAYGRSRLSVTSKTSSNPSEYLHVAAGMLRHLAITPDLRQRFFRDIAARQTALALAQYSQPDVQIAGIRLLRQLISDRGLMSDEHVDILIKIFNGPAADDRTKSEISRTITALLRRSSGDLDGHPALLSFSVSEETLGPTAYAAKSKLPLAQAEGWLALCFALHRTDLTSSEGFQVVSNLFLHDTSLLTALRAQIVGKHPTLRDDPAATSPADVNDSLAELDISGEPSAALVSGEGEDKLPLQGERIDAAGAMQSKARDNAIVLLSELLKSEVIDHDLRDELDSIAAEAGITLRL